MLGAELFATLWASGPALAAPPVLADAEFAKVVHAGQHDRFAEQIITHGTCQVLSQAAFGEGGCRNTSRAGVRSRCHGERQVSPLWECKQNPEKREQLVLGTCDSLVQSA